MDIITCYQRNTKHSNITIPLNTFNENCGPKVQKVCELQRTVMFRKIVSWNLFIVMKATEACNNYKIKPKKI